MKKTLYTYSKKVDLIKQTLLIFILLISFVNCSYAQLTSLSSLEFEIFDGEASINPSDKNYYICPFPHSGDTSTIFVYLFLF